MRKARASPHPASLRPSFSFRAVFFTCMPRASGGFHPVLLFRALSPARRAFPAGFPFSLPFRAFFAFHTLPAGETFAVPFRLSVSYHMPRPVGIPPVSIVIFGARFDRRRSGKREKELFSVFSGSGFPLYRGFMYRAARKAAERGVRKRRCRGVPVIGEYDAAPVPLRHCLFRSSCIRFCTVAGGARLYPSRKECLYSGVMPPGPAASRIGGTYRKELG